MWYVFNYIYYRLILNKCIHQYVQIFFILHIFKCSMTHWILSTAPMWCFPNNGILIIITQVLLYFLQVAEDMVNGDENVQSQVTRQTHICDLTYVLYTFRIPMLLINDKLIQYAGTVHQRSIARYQYGCHSDQTQQIGAMSIILKTCCTHCWPIGLMVDGYLAYSLVYHIRADSRFVPSQLEMVLFCNDVTHRLGTNL